MNDQTSRSLDDNGAQHQALSEIVALYDQGQYVRAYQVGVERLGPIENWPDVRGRVLAGRVAYNLGATRWSQAWHWRVVREFPNHPESSYYQYSLLTSRRGPFETWRRLRELSRPEAMTDKQWAELLGLRAHVQALLRDFTGAKRDLEAAFQLAPDHVWILVDQHAVLAAMDRREQALESTARALAIRPYYRPAAQCHAYLLVQLNRDDEALDLLHRAAAHNQSGDLWSQLVAFYYETDQYDLAAECLQRAESLYVLRDRDKGLKKWLASRQSDLAYQRGDFEQAIRFAETVDTPFFKSVTQSMREALEHPERAARRILLNVHFVRQHHMTCAPATLAALSGYWQRPVDHVELSQAICYDGTPAHEERHWADSQGYITNEFRVTWDNARALIERGLPFTLTTIGPQTGHLQPVIGFDERRGVLLVRDPGERHHVEYRAQELLDHFSSSGPRGMVLVPREQESLLEGLELDEASFYDLCYALQLELKDHNRIEAAALLDELRRLDPTHRLTLHAEATLAWYDQDRVRQLRAVAPLAARFPKDVNQQLAYLSLLREMGRKSEWLKQLRELCVSKDADPVYWRMLANELIEDGRTLNEASQWIRRLLKRRQSGDDLRTASRLYWRNGARNLAVETLRLATLIESRDESLAAEYFTMAREIGQTETALEFLRQRHRELGRQSSGPTYTMVWALDACDRHTEAAEALEQGRAWRPTDGDVLLTAAQFFMGWGRAAEARELLRQAEPVSNRARWLNTAARLAAVYDDLETQEALFREALALQPLNVSTVRALYVAIGDRQGTDAALEFLESYVAQYPEHYDLRQLWIIELRREAQTDRWLTELETMLELHPDDPWALRELALVLLDLHQGERALPYSERAREIEPDAPASWSVWGQVLTHIGRRDEAIDAFEASLKRSIDWEPAFEMWMQLCEVREERIRALNVVRRELKSQVVNGDLLLTLTDYVQPTLDDEAALALFREMHAARPDLFQSGLALAEMLRRQGRLDEAQTLMDQTTERFSLIPRVWFDASGLARERGDEARQIEFLRRALAINPRWPQALYRLALTLQSAGHSEEAEELLQKSLTESPRDPILRCALAEIYWRRERSAEAIQTMTEIVRHRPDFGYAWDCLQEWVQKLEKPGLVADTARQLAAERPNELHSWTLLADVLPPTPETWQERCDAVQRALEINPLAIEVLRRKAYLSAEGGDFEQALATCQTVIHGRPSRVLQLSELDLLADYRSLKDATERLKAMLIDDPDSASLWHRLADWSEKIGDWNAYYDACQQMVRTAPGYAISWGYHGDALLRQGQRANAIAAFEKAVQLDPKYEFAVNNLLDLYVAEKKIEIAQRILDRTGPYISPGLKLLGQIQLALVQNQFSTVPGMFEQLVVSEGASLATKYAVVKQMEAHGQLPRARQILSDLMGSRDDTDIGHLWASSAVMAGKQEVAHAFRQLAVMPTPHAGWHLACQILFSSASSCQEQVAGSLLIQRRAEDLSRNDGSWSAAAEYLLDARENYRGNKRRLSRWIASWPERGALTMYQWFQVMRAVVTLNDWDSAVAIGERALNNANAVNDENGELIRLWFTLALMRRGDWRRANQQIALFRDFETVNFYQMLRKYLRRVQLAANELMRIGPQAPLATRRGIVQSLRTDLTRDSELKAVNSNLFQQVAAQVDDQLSLLAGFSISIWKRLLRWLFKRSY